jgi:hypothetical protein
MLLVHAPRVAVFDLWGAAGAGRQLWLGPHRATRGRRQGSVCGRASSCQRARSTCSWHWYPMERRRAGVLRHTRPAAGVTKDGTRSAPTRAHRLAWGAGAGRRTLSGCGNEMPAAWTDTGSPRISATGSLWSALTGMRLRSRAPAGLRSHIRVIRSDLICRPALDRTRADIAAESGQMTGVVQFRRILGCRRQNGGQAVPRGRACARRRASSRAVRATPPLTDEIAAVAVAKPGVARELVHLLPRPHNLQVWFDRA